VATDQLKRPELSGDDLARAATAIRLTDLELVFKVGQGHLGSDFSAIDILTTLYLGGILKVDPDHPDDPDRDRFVLSKGHTAGGLYCVLAEAGFLPKEQLETFLAPLSALNGHPNRLEVAGVETNTGPLGHGFPVAVGTAIAAKIRGAGYHTYALCGDGELQEGSMWEAAMTAGNRGLDNLTLIIDRNRLQQGARTEATNGLEPLVEKFEAFGWFVVNVEGNDPEALLKLFRSRPATGGRPTCVVARTDKGSGVSFMSDNVAWHHKVPNADEYAAARLELEEAM
jgi:transketolase